jgi:hypothetical protein
MVSPVENGRPGENQKPETGNPNEAPNPKPKAGPFGISGFGHSFGFLVSGFGFFLAPEMKQTPP